jgi:hypothetical protein
MFPALDRWWVDTHRELLATPSVAQPLTPTDGKRENKQLVGELRVWAFGVDRVRER